MLILKHETPVLGDSEALMMLTGRSVHTIRARCVVVKRRGRTPLYDIFAEVERLALIPVRRRS